MAVHLQPARTRLRMLTGLRAVLVPYGVVECVERDLEVAALIIFRYRKPPPRDVHLQGGQDQLRHWQGPVAVGAELHETCLVLAIHMGIFRLLLSNGAFPRWGSAAGLVVVSADISHWETLCGWI